MAASARRPKLAGEPAYGIRLHRIHGESDLLRPPARGALEGPFLQTSLSSRDPRQGHPVFAHRTHRTIVRRSHTPSPSHGDLQSTQDRRAVSIAIGTQVSWSNWSGGPCENAGLRGLASPAPIVPKRRGRAQSGGSLASAGSGADRKLMGRLWQILKAAFSGFLTNDALSRGALRPRWRRCF